MSPLRTPRRRWIAVAVAVPLFAGGTALAAGQATADSVVHTITSEVHDSVGSLFTATNHLVDLPGVVPVGEPGHEGKEYIVVWAGDENVADTSGQDIADTPLAVGAVKELSELPTDLPGQDFLAVIDADADSPSYGQVVNTVTLGPLPENEPHHMQYIHTAGDNIYAGGLFSDITYVFDTDKLPLLELSGVSNPVDTPCGSVPDAYWVLEDGTAYGTYMGGPDVPGPCQYTNGEVRVGNGFAGSPGSVVRLDEQGRTLAEVPAALPTAEFPEDCHNLPVLPTATCANPHGIQVREDLDTMVTSDYCEPRNIILDPVKAPDHKLCRPTIRTWDITDRNNPVVRNVTKLPDGPRRETNPAHEENQAIMETTVTNLPENKGAFAESMCGGAIFYAPDITAPEPAWREVFDNTTAALSVDPDVIEGGGCDGGGWVQTSLDDEYLYHAVIGRGPGAQFPEDQGTTKMIYTLDIRSLIAAGTDVDCNIDTILEVAEGGEESDCPALVDVLEVTDTTSGGPHWGALDNYAANGDGTYSETTDVERIAYSNYFVARTGIDGNHRVCIADVEDGVMSVDEDFRDEARGGTCVDFNRLAWPHGETGNAKPHSMIFVVAGGDVR